MFADVDADIYVLVDGDATYDSASVGTMIARLVDDGLDMVVGVRRDQEQAAYRPGHRFGNRLLTGFVAHVFGAAFADMLSGYRVFSRRFVKSFPAITGGFEIETELTVHAIDLRVPVAEIPVPYAERPAGSASKLRSVRDGLRILWTLVLLAKEVRPFSFFALWAALFAATSLALAYPLLVTFWETGLVPRLPTAVLATGIMLLSFLSLACGLILDSVGRGRHEMKRLHYLGCGSAAADDNAMRR
jgi:hypothetical protein